jgi:hypothetical protein
MFRLPPSTFSILMRSVSFVSPHVKDRASYSGVTGGEVEVVVPYSSRARARSLPLASMRLGGKCDTPKLHLIFLLSP